MKKRYGVSKRIMAMLLSAVMVLSLVPVIHTAWAVSTEPKQADLSTLDSWKTFFDPADLTTEHAGGVWTDKSVFADNGPFGAGIALEDDKHFLVALSALGANSIVVGKSAVPTDTMFVLDVSNSMSNEALSNMVSATNNAIRTLLSGSENTGRVGVVLYDTTASVLLPLDHYTGVSINGVETFLELDGSSIRTARARVQVGTSQAPDWWNPSWGQWPPDWWQGDTGEYETKYVTDSDGNNVNTSVGVGGGTYIQGGLWAAWNQFNNAPAVTSDGATGRSPVIVLMSDGAPTYSAADFDNVASSATHGSGNTSRVGDGFVTQLTAAYIKEKLASKYGSSAYFYTLGLGVEDIDIAKAVLDPATSTAAAGISSLWTEYLNAEDSIEVQMYRRGNNSGLRDTTITKADDVAFTADSYKYVNRYFSAAQVTDLNRQFQDIVNEINLQAGYYPTRLDDNGSNHSGYVTFVDHIGKGMEVKEVEGIMVGDTLYAGFYMSLALVNGMLGTQENPTNMGDNMVWAVKQRLGITENDEVYALLEHAYGVAKTLSFVDPDDADDNIIGDEIDGDEIWSNYIGWYGDANGNYLGYDSSLEQTATFYNACYGFLGTTTDTAQPSDMMYITVQVSTNLTTNEQIVTFRIPASLLPVVTYEIDVGTDSVENATDVTLTYHEANPVRLVYEVGMRDDITERDVIDYAKYDGGKFYLYTNQWDITSGNSLTANTANNTYTYSYFEPSAENEHYYFTEDTVIYKLEGAQYVPVASTETLNHTTQYYFQHRIFEVPDNAQQNADGSWPAVVVRNHYGELTDAVIEETMNLAAANGATVKNGMLCVPQGVMHHNIDHSHDAIKGSNATMTYGYARTSFVDAVVSGATLTGHHYELTYLGNNGRLEVTPATGIAVTKHIDNTITDPNAEYTFTITLTGTGVAGQTFNGIRFNSNGVANVTLKAGETVYIYDLPVGTRYEVTEQYGDSYKGTAVNADGTVEANVVKLATFLNTVRGTGSLNIEKEVIDHPFTTAEIETVQFPFTVTLAKADGTPYSGALDAYKSRESAAGVTDVTLNFVNGTADFTLHAYQELVIPNLPEGVTYTVTEGTKSGYTLAASTGTADTIAANTVSTAQFINRYVPVAGNLPLTVEITKVLNGTLSNAEDFTFKVEQLIAGGGFTDVGGQLVIASDAANKTVSVQLDALPYTTVGTYTYRITEVAGATNGMTYDSSRGIFVVNVTDVNFDGVLEIDVDTQASANVEVTEPTATLQRHTVKKTFTNSYHLNATTAYFKLKKQISNTTGIEMPLTNFHFGMYPETDPKCTGQPLQTFTAGPNGDVDVSMHIDTVGTKVYYLKEIPGDVVGMTYDPVIYKVIVESEDISSQLVATVTIDVAEANGSTSTEAVVENVPVAVFNNRYQVAATQQVVLSGQKILQNRPWGSNESFTILLHKSDAGFQNMDLLDSATVTQNNPNYAFDIGAFTQVGVHHFIITEQRAGALENGLSYDTAVYHVTVSVTRGQQTTTVGNETMHQLVASVESLKLGVGSAASDALDFVNIYTADATDELILGGTKKLLNETPGVPANTYLPLRSGEFNFTLEVKDADDAVIAIGSAANAADGTFRFEPVRFTKAGTYRASITETVGTVDFITYLQAPLVFEIVVVDDGLGKLHATIDGNPVSEYMPEVINRYTAKPTKLGLTGFKELEAAAGTDRVLAAGDFSFTLKPVGNAPMPDGMTSVSVTNGNADSVNKFVFPNISYNAVGEFTYTVEEDREADGTNGIVYDKAVHTVTVTVTDNGTGQLHAQVSKILADLDPNDGTVTTKHVIDFYNSYYADAVSFAFDGTKTLTGRDLVDGEFSFILKDAEGTVLQTKTNTDGKFVFDPIVFDSVGTYRYTIEEDRTDPVSGVKYDTTVHEITILVDDDGVGHLKAYVQGQEATSHSVAFSNTYTKPIPDTGDHTDVVGLGLTMGISAAALILLLVLGKNSLWLKRD